MTEDTKRDAASPSRDPFGLCGVTIQDKYQVTSVVGHGGFGVVYRGIHTGFGEPIAVKCLKLAGDPNEHEREELLARLQDEGRVLHRLSRLSSGITQALDVGAFTADDGRWVPYLVLEWLEGETLGDRLRPIRRGEAPPLEIAEAVELLKPAAAALGVAHSQKVAHRDVKPENLFLMDVGGKTTLKVLDFGIAKVLHEHTSFSAAPAATQKQPTAFTPAYGAPEQFNKKRGATGPWTDVFALALIFVELVCGERALDGDDATQLYIAAADPAARPTLRYKGVVASDAVEAVLAKALAVEPSERYQDATIFFEALAEAAGAEPPAPVVNDDATATGDFVSQNELPVSSLPATRAEGGSAPPVANAPTTVAGRPSKRSGEASRRRVDETQLPTETVVPKAGSKWTLPIVVLLALIGAGLLYAELQGIEPADVISATGGAPTPNPTSASTSPRANGSGAPAPSARGDGGGGGLGGAGGASGGGGAGGAASEPVPEGMAYVPLGRGGFFIDAHEITLKEYQACVMAGRCVPADRVVLTPDAAQAIGLVVDDSVTPEGLAEAWGERCNATRGGDAQPVNCVNHGSAEDYCRFVDKRLPRSGEWDVAATSGSRRYPWGDAEPSCELACFGLNGSCVGVGSDEVATCAVGARAKDVTPQGVHDLAGNVSEWVSDEVDAPGRGPSWRIIRGGSFADAPRDLVVSRAVPPASAHVTIGFRCARDAPEGFEPPDDEEQP